MKIKLTHEIDMTDRDSVRDTIDLFKKYVKLLNKKWQKMEVK